MSDTITVPRSEWQQMKRTLGIIEKNAITADLINEAHAAELLGMKERSLQTRVSAGEMSGLYVTGARGRRFYYKSKLMGL